jgi:hypothetical protein
MDFRSALEHSPAPSLTLVQAYLAYTDKAVTQRKIQGLLKTYTAEEILEAIFIMADREIERPFPYMIGILRNTRAKRLAINGRNGRDAVASAVNMLTGESKREDRPTLRSPFDVVTIQP